MSLFAYWVSVTFKVIQMGIQITGHWRVLLGEPLKETNVNVREAMLILTYKHRRKFEPYGQSLYTFLLLTLL